MDNIGQQGDQVCIQYYVMINNSLLSAVQYINGRIISFVLLLISNYERRFV